MNQKLIKYLIHEKHYQDTLMPGIILKITKYDDIYQEFLYWLDQRNYQSPNPVIIEGYSAQDIYNLANFLDGIGVYNLLVDLRDHSDRTKQHLAEGLPRR